MVSGKTDYLAVSDANVGATKGDYYAHKSMVVKVEVLPTGVALHHVTLSYTMPAPVDAVDRALNPGDGSYRDYLQVLIPETATVVDVTFKEDGKAGDGGLDGVTAAHGRQSVAVYFRLPRGHAGVVDLYYELPVATDRAFALYVQKQAGVPSLPTSFALSYPGGLALREAQLLIATSRWRWHGKYQAEAALGVRSDRPRPGPPWRSPHWLQLRPRDKVRAARSHPLWEGSSRLQARQPRPATGSRLTSSTLIWPSWKATAGPPRWVAPLTTQA